MLKTTKFRPSFQCWDEVAFKNNLLISRLRPEIRGAIRNILIQGFQHSHAPLIAGDDISLTCLSESPSVDHWLKCKGEVMSGFLMQEVGEDGKEWYRHEILDGTWARVTNSLQVRSDAAKRRKHPNNNALAPSAEVMNVAASAGVTMIDRDGNESVVSIRECAVEIMGKLLWWWSGADAEEDIPALQPTSEVLIPQFGQLIEKRNANISSLVDWIWESKSWWFTTPFSNARTEESFLKSFLKNYKNIEKKFIDSID
jgi:hypothetical protein